MSIMDQNRQHYYGKEACVRRTTAARAVSIGLYSQQEDIFRSALPPKAWWLNASITWKHVALKRVEFAVYALIIWRGFNSCQLRWSVNSPFSCVVLPPFSRLDHQTSTTILSLPGNVLMPVSTRSTVLGKRHAPSEPSPPSSPSANESNQCGLITPDTTPSAKRVKISSPFVDDGSNKENIPPFRVDIVNASPDHMRTPRALRRTSTIYDASPSRRSM